MFTLYKFGMDDMTALKSEIDGKLEKELANLAVLKESLNKSNTNTQNMLSILGSFESRLRKLESTIVPVYQETENLRRRQENVEKTMGTLDNVIGYYHVANEMEMTIRNGPSTIGLDKYLMYMDKLLRALKYFTQHNTNALELTDVSRIFDEGMEVLEREFRSLLSRHGKPVPPVIIMDLLGTDDELHSVDSATPLEHLPERVIDDLGDISKWLVANGSTTDFLGVYSTQRSIVLVKSLQGLKEHMKSSSASSSVYMPHSPALSGKFRGSKDTPVRKSRKDKSYFKLASTALLKSPFQSGHKRQVSSIEATREDIIEVDTVLYITEFTALLKLMQSEFLLMIGIIPEKHQRMVFDKVVQQALDLVVNEGELLASNGRKYIARHEYQSVLGVFPVVRHLRSIKPEFDLALEGCQAPTRARLASLLSSLDNTGARALEEFIENIRNDPDKTSNMPRDGTVHELTNHTIIFLEQLQEYSETAGTMLLMHTDPSAHVVGIQAEKSKLKISDFLSRVLSALGLNLSNKAETYSDATLRSIFMLNNYNYILKSLKRCGLMDLVHMSNSAVESSYVKQIADLKQEYSKSWSRVLTYALEINKPISSQRISSPDLQIKLKDKDKQNAKDKFSGFNKELEDVLKIQKGYAIPDSILREEMKEENKVYILPRYKMFHDKYSRLNFTKNLDKYIKYSVNDVSAMIDKFFDASA